MNFKKLGIALAGGGGKGAYQIGVWNALREAGLEAHIAAVAGTSVGGLNGAMMAQGRYDLAEQMWLKVEAHNLLTLEGAPGLAEWLARKLPPGPILSRLMNSAASKGLFKRAGLQAMIAQGVDAALLAGSAIPLTVTWHHEADNRVVYHTLRDPDTVADGLLATAALPMIFDQVGIDGEFYSDGGFYWSVPGRRLDNVPVRALQDAGCDTVIVVCLSQDDLTVAPQQFPGMRVIPIVPRRALGSVMATLDFSNDGAAGRMEQGYADAREILRHLEMYLDSGERYRQLWEEVARVAGQEAATDARLDAGARAHARTVGDIGDFDRIVANDDFASPLQVGEGEGVDGLPSGLDLGAAALLADIDRARIRTNVEHFVASCGRDQRAIEDAVLDAIAALAPVPGRADAAREEGTLSRLFGMLTGRHQKLAADNDAALAEGQYALLRLVNAVQRQGAANLEFSCVLQNRLQGALQEMARLGQRQNDDLARVYRSMAGIYGKLRERLMRHEARLDALERQGRLHSWLLHTSVPRYDGRRLDQLPPTLRLATLANDFFHLTGGAWSVEELMSAREMCCRVGMDGLRIGLGAFFRDLVSDRASASTLMDALAAQALPVPAQGAAGWLLELRHRRLGAGPADVGAAVASWRYGTDTELPAWDLLVEMLYHMRAAGLAPVRHGSELAALKDEWTRQLAVLDGMVDERLLPPAFRREIAPVRDAIAGFRLKVPLVGKFSAGKSSLVNCWLDRDVQAIDLGACTSAPAEFHHAAGGIEKLVAHWAPATPDGATVQEAFADAYMDERRILAFAQGRTLLHIERHCDLPALRRYPDLVVVDTPGIGSASIDHDLALAHYLGEGVLFILCANRGQIGTEETAFIRRQKQLGQAFSLLVCQEDLNNPSERESLQRSLAEQAGLAADQLVRGCSARERNLAGFDDLLAHVERSKGTLFVRRLGPAVEALLQRARHLVEQTLAVADDAALAARRAQVLAAIEALESACKREEQALLADCAGSVAQAVMADVGSFMRARRSAYAERIDASQELASLIAADAQNAFELGTRRHFGARLERTARALEQQADIGSIGALAFGAGAPEYTGSQTGAGLGKAAGMVGSAAGAWLGLGIPAAGGSAAAMAAGATVGSVFPFVGTAIGGIVGGLLGKYLLGSMQRVTSTDQANQAIEVVCKHVEGQAATLLEAQARTAFADLRRQVEARLDSERENVERLDTQLHEHARSKEETKQRASAALAKIGAMVAQRNTQD